ncbi:MAG TPA: hypothetical protein VLQ45_25645 [Thermoanaerobaculia bacterium]|nr:hypothetical protein [Thermoanaerobaculia bacterium]
MSNRIARRIVVVLILLTWTALPVAAEPARSRPAGPMAAISDFMTGLVERLVGLRQKDGEPTPPPTGDNQAAPRECRSTIDPWGCPEP